MRHPVSLLLCKVCALTLTLGSPPTSNRLTAVAQTVTPEDRKAEADRLLTQGNQLYRDSQWQEALQAYQAALDIYHEIDAHEAFPQESRTWETQMLRRP